VVIGDARLELARIAPGSFDVLLVDAFSSDSIPLHLITREALGVYARFAPDGVMLMRIFNRFLDPAAGCGGAGRSTRMGGAAAG